jgi:uncharacterized membrane protein required for colicin V production
MINITTIFWFMVIFFGIIGMLRGWTKEVIAMSGIILVMFAINQFGIYVMGFVGSSGNVTTDTEQARRQVFYIFSTTLLVITFFSYQSPSISSKLAGKLKVRDNFQDKFMGFVVGSVNGYLIVGSLLSFLEYLLNTPGDWVQLPAGVGYPFSLETIARPEFQSLMNVLPMPVMAPYLPIFLVLVFLFVIVVMI